MVSFTNVVDPVRRRHYARSVQQRPAMRDWEGEAPTEPCAARREARPPGDGSGVRALREGEAPTEPGAARREARPPGDGTGLRSVRAVGAGRGERGADRDDDDFDPGPQLPDAAIPGGAVPMVLPEPSAGADRGGHAAGDDDRAPAVVVDPINGPARYGRAVRRGGVPGDPHPRRPQRVRALSAGRGRAEAVEVVRNAGRVLHPPARSLAQG